MRSLTPPLPAIAAPSSGRARAAAPKDAVPFSSILTSTSLAIEVGGATYRLSGAGSETVLLGVSSRLDPPLHAEKSSMALDAPTGGSKPRVKRVSMHEPRMCSRPPGAQPSRLQSGSCESSRRAAKTLKARRLSSYSRSDASHGRNAPSKIRCAARRCKPTRSTTNPCATASPASASIGRSLSLRTSAVRKLTIRCESCARAEL